MQDIQAGSKKGRMKILVFLTKGFRGLLAVSAITTLIAIFFNFLTPQVFRFTVDSVLGEQPFPLPAGISAWLGTLGGRDFLRNNLIICAGASLLCAVFSEAATYFCRVSIAKSAEGMVNKLRDRLYTHIQKLPYHWHVQHQTGDIVQRCTSDVDVVRNFLSGQLLEMFRTVFLIGVALALMFSMNARMSIVASVFMPLVLLYSSVFYGKISKKSLRADEAEGDLFATVQENYTGVRVVRAFGRQAYEIERFDKKNNLFARLWIKLGNLLACYWGFGDFFSNVQVLCIIVLGAAEAVAGNITMGEFLVFVSYNSMLVWPVRNLGRILSEMSKTGVSLGRINEILNAETEEDAPEDTEPDMSGDLEFSHITFDYHGEGEVLKDVSFTVKAGTTFGILGGTGSGKSTLMYLLDRLYDLPENGGKISVGGVDIRKIKRAWLRKNIGFVLQEPFLFSKTIKENIGIGSEKPDMGEVRRSAAVAAVDETIDGFALGYDTVVGERGVTLSGGQKQRVAIARMLMSRAPIMIFDDSLSAVDAETDAKIRAALQRDTGASTVILISHRITTLMRADEILVLEDGRVAQFGTHTELSEQEGVYKQIFELQGSLEDELGPDLEKGGAK